MHPSTANVDLQGKFEDFNSLRPNDNIYVSKLTIMGSDNGLLPGLCQATVWANTGILLIGIRKNFSEILIEIHSDILLEKVHLKISSGEWQPFCVSLNVLTKLTMLSCKHPDLVFYPHFARGYFHDSPPIILSVHLSLHYCFKYYHWHGRSQFLPKSSQ